MRFTQTAINRLAPPAGKADFVVFDDAMPGFGVRFRNGGAGTFFVQYKIGSKHGRLSLGKVSKITLDAAKVAARKAFAEVAGKTDPVAERAKAAAKLSDTIEPLIDDFLAFIKDSPKDNGQKRAASYVAEVTRTLKEYCKGLHRFAPDDITRKMIAERLAKIRTERGPIAADRSRAHLSKFFSWAIGEGLAEQNPVRGTNKNGGQKRERVLSDAELAAIWKALDGDDDYSAVCRLLILTGARRDEVGSLTRREINFDQRQIELHGSRTKSGEPHVIPLSRQAMAILKARPAREDSEFVFGRGEGGFSGWSKSKERLDEKLTDLERWVLHDFRRLLSTTMHGELKVAPHIVESVLGHVGVHKSGVAGVYNYAQYLDERREALQSYADYVERLTRPKLAVVR